MIVHDETTGYLKQGIINVAKFVVHDVESDRQGAKATGAAGAAGSAAARETLSVATLLVTNGIIGSLISKTDTTL